MASMPVVWLTEVQIPSLALPERAVLEGVVKYVPESELAAVTRERDALQKRLDDKNDFLSLNAAAFTTKCVQLREEVARLTRERDENEGAFKVWRRRCTEAEAEVERLRALLRDGASDSTPEQHTKWVERRRAALGEEG